MEAKLKAIFQDVLGVPPEKFSDELSCATLPEWDSIMHLTLILAIEQKFGVTFEPETIAKLTSVGAIKQTLLTSHPPRGAEGAGPG